MPPRLAALLWSVQDDEVLCQQCSTALNAGQWAPHFLFLTFARVPCQLPRCLPLPTTMPKCHFRTLSESRIRPSRKHNQYIFKYILRLNHLSLSGWEKALQVITCSGNARSVLKQGRERFFFTTFRGTKSYLEGWSNCLNEFRILYELHGQIWLRLH